MSEFFERMKTDARFSAIIKLSIYGVFVLIALIIILFGGKPINNNDDEDDNVSSFLIDLPSDYNYSMTIKLDERSAIYKISNTASGEEIIKQVDETSETFLKLNDNYYLTDGDNLVKTSLENIFDIISYEYLDIDNINGYIRKIKTVDDTYLVYLNDIDQNYNSNEYIKFNFGTNEVEIDYTSLLKETNADINSCTVLLRYDGKE